MLPWCKLATDFFSNRKVRKAGRDGASVFLFVLTRNGAGDGRGWIDLADLDPDYIADQVQMSQAEAQNGIDRAVKAQLIRIEGTKVVICGWDGEWAKVPKTGAERMRGWRSRLANSSDVHRVTQRHSDATTHENRHEVTRDADSPSHNVTVTQETRREEKRSRSALDQVGEDLDPLEFKETGADATPAPVAVTPGKVRKPRQVRPKAETIGERCWKAADVLRDMVLHDDPRASVSRAPWDAKTGIRLQWADTIRLLVERDGKSFEEVWGAMRWVRDQPPGRFRVVVESAKALREKWDQIQRHMRNGGTSQGGNVFDAVDRAVEALEMAEKSA